MTMGDDNDGTFGVDIDNGLLEDDETLDGRGVDVLDEGYTVPERPWEREHYGVTVREAHEHESLAGRLARELPDPRDTDVGDGLGDTVGTDGELYDNEVGAARSGRLVDIEAAGGGRLRLSERRRRRQGWRGSQRRGSSRSHRA